MPRSDLLSWKQAKRGMYWVHRWTGIVLCALFAIWFISGVVMMYVPFSSFRAEERVSVAKPVDWAQVRYGPDEILERSTTPDAPDEMRLEMAGGEPVYRATFEDGRKAWSAATGEEIVRVDTQGAIRIAEAVAGTKAQSATPVTRDQWVVTKAYARIAPFWRVRMDDGAGTDIYVTQKTGEIVQNTDRAERFWNWLGAVPHWIYFEFLRVYQEPWRQVVIWTSGVGIVGSILGVWIGILRVRLKRRYSSGSTSPYRGWMKWHHIAGLIGGVFVITWAFSGWLSMSPFGGLPGGDARSTAERYTGEKAPHFAATDLAQLARSALDVREVRFLHIGGAPTILAIDGHGSKRALDGVTANPLAPTHADIEQLARRAVQGGDLVSTELLTEHDVYWYATGDPRRGARPLPVLRLSFDDPYKTWLHIDPATGELLGQSDSGRRTYRWLFSALHSFDLPLLLRHRVLRDSLMIILSIAGLIVSVSGIVVGWRVLRRKKPRKRTLRRPEVALRKGLEEARAPLQQGIKAASMEDA
jgi:uncharacterized iron-regulated membrane protein